MEQLKQGGWLFLWVFICFGGYWIATEHPWEPDPRPGDIWSSDPDDPFDRVSTITILRVQDGYAEYKMKVSTFSNDFSHIKINYDLAERPEG